MQGKGGKIGSANSRHRKRVDGPKGLVMDDEDEAGEGVVVHVHPKAEELKAIGICYVCNCPHYNHYHICKHSLALGLHFKMVKIPQRFSMETVWSGAGLETPL